MKTEADWSDTAEECQRLPGAARSQEREAWNKPSLRTSRGNPFCQHLACGFMESGKNNLLLFQAAKCLVMCYGSLGKLTRSRC